MGAFIGSPTWYVKKSGDTMSGNLSFDVGKWVAGHAKVKVGTYTGDGNDNRSINIGVELNAKSNIYIIIKGNGGGNVPVHRVEYAQGDLTMVYTGEVDRVNLIQFVNATGFVIGDDISVNNNGDVYRYIVFYDEP